MAALRPRGPLISCTPALLPKNVILPGRTIHLEKLNPSHADDLFTLVGGTDPSTTFLWDYMGDGPYTNLDTFKQAITSKSTSTDPFFFAVIDKRSTEPTFDKPIGYLSLMRITPDHLTIEIGNVLFSSTLQRTTAATEAIYLLAKYAFDDLKYRRVEWKCDDLNAPSRKAALRLGFTFEGTFRQHMVVKGRSRDTAWFSVLQGDWDKSVKGAMEKWLDEDNFGDDGSQKRSLRDLRVECD